MSTGALRPFFRYYGGKWRLAPLYPKPRHRTLIEPFAGSAGYALRHPDRDVILVEKSPTIASIWEFLIQHATPREIRSLPLVDCVDDLPGDLHPGVYALVGFSMNAACATPRRALSSGARRLRERGRRFYGWTEALRERVASQLAAIAHWQIFRGEYDSITSRSSDTSWFIDPPYEGPAGAYYFGARELNREKLRSWIAGLHGQIIVCEGPDAKWLPGLSPLAVAKTGPGKRAKAELVLIRNQ